MKTNMTARMRTCLQQKLLIFEIATTKGQPSVDSQELHERLIKSATDNDADSMLLHC